MRKWTRAGRIFDEKILVGGFLIHTYGCFKTFFLPYRLLRKWNFAGPNHRMSFLGTEPSLLPAEAVSFNLSKET
eukprot:scaffold24742_cov211-Cylindrotheca_fusiformis.AAC.1